MTNISTSSAGGRPGGGAVEYAPKDADGASLYLKEKAILNASARIKALEGQIREAREALEKIATNKGTDAIAIMQMRNTAICALSALKSAVARESS